MKKSLIASFLLCAAALPAQEQEFGSTVATTRDPPASVRFKVSPKGNAGTAPGKSISAANARSMTSWATKGRAAS